MSSSHRRPLHEGYFPVEPTDSFDRESLADHATHGDEVRLLHNNLPMYPPQRPGASGSQSSLPFAQDTSRHVHMTDDPVTPSFPQGYDAERAQSSAPGSTTNPTRTGLPHRSSQSWDILAGIKKFENSYEEFDTRHASQSHLVYADGDVPKNKFVRLYNYLLNVSIISRWILFIVPVLGILWIPGILALTSFPKAQVWGIGLLWWSIWLSVAWVGWWGALAASLIMPSIAKATIGLIAVGTRRYIDWAAALHRYIALFAWALAVWVSWQPLIDNQQRDASPKSVKIIDLIGKLLFALFLCCGVLLFEKFAIQWIAGKFHERSYAERIADQKFAVKSLVTLYRHSVDTPGRSDTLRSGPAPRGTGITTKKFFKRFRDGVKNAATTTTTAFGNVASEIAGSSVLQPNSPQAMVKTALESANKSRLLARRLFYSFTKSRSEYMFLEDIRQFFETSEEAEQVYALFDKDANGDASRDEVEMACLELHREQLSIEHSMRDLDSAVGRLDNIFMSLYVIIAGLIIAVAMEAQLVTLITGAGTLILGLSWLIGGTCQEVLTSIIFLFIKHPFDVGDRVKLSGETYVVKEIRLLSTIFLNGDGCLVQAPNMLLNGQFIQNFRRSPQMSETFTFDVSYSTSFEDIERLREKMLEFVTRERRDYQPSFDVNIKDFPEQEKMILSCDIKYKSNAQQAGLKAIRRNKWICAFKTALGELKIYGPKGNPDPGPSVSRYTEVPWSLVQANDNKPAEEVKTPGPGVSWKLTDQNAALLDDGDDIFNEADELHMTSPRRGPSQGTVEGLPYRTTAAGATMPMPTTGVTMPTAGPFPENIEMTRRP